MAIVNADDPVATEMAAASRVPVWRYGVEASAAEFTAHRRAGGPGGRPLRGPHPRGYFPRAPPADGPVQRVQFLGCGGGGPLGRRGPGGDSARFGSGCGGCRAGSSGWTEASRSRCWWTTPTPPTVWKTCCGRPASFTHKKLWVVFGCGGDRDRAKRPLMGGGRGPARGSGHHHVGQSPQRRSRSHLRGSGGGGPTGPGAEGEAQSDVAVIVDRREAIAEAITGARPGDLVLIAGKGHETEQIFRDRTVHFDDREEAAVAIRRRLQHDGFAPVNRIASFIGPVPGCGGMDGARCRGEHRQPHHAPRESCLSPW